MYQFNQTDHDGWTEIKSSEDWTWIDAQIKGGEDGVIKDLHWSHGEYVDLDRNMVYDGPPNVWLLVQFQNQPVSSIEFLLQGVMDLELHRKHDVLINVEFTDGGVTLQLSAFDDLIATPKGSKVVGKVLLYKIPDPPRLGSGSFDGAG